MTKSKDDEERSPMISDDNQVPYDEDDDDDDEDSDIEDESMENKSMKSVKMEEGKQSLSPTGNPNARPQSLDSSSSIYPSHRQFTTPSSATTRYGLTTPSVELTYTTSPRSTPNDPIM